MGHLSNDMLQALIGTLNAASKDLNVVYEELRQNVSPDSDTRRRIDTCSAVTKKSSQVTFIYSALFIALYL